MCWSQWRFKVTIQMLSCEHVRSELSNFIDGDIEPGAKLEIENHLRLCRHCSVLNDSLRKVLVIVAATCSFEVPLGFSTRLHLFLDRQIG